jgi:hypothetical protein
MAAGIPAAVATIGGAILSNKSNNQATKTQAQANAEALAMAKDNEARRRQEYDQQIAAERAQWDAEQARLEPYRNAQNALLGQASNRLGLNIGALGGARSATPYPGTVAANGTNTGRTLSQLAGGTGTVYNPPVPEVQAAPQLSIADIANWGSPRRMS